jgi:hypothetical protein
MEQHSSIALNMVLVFSSAVPASSYPVDVQRPDRVAAECVQPLLLTTVAAAVNAVLQVTRLRTPQTFS